MKKLLSLLLSVLLLTATLTACGDDTTADPHAGHNHGTSTTADAHEHGTTVPSAVGVKYQVYTNADKTYRLVIRDHKNAILFEADQLIHNPIKQTIDEQKGIYELGWATGSGATDYECVYYCEKTGQVSQQFHAPLGTDGARIAYCSADSTKVIVQDLFNQQDYKQEYVLEDAYNHNGTVITGGKLQADKKTVLVSYYTNEKGESRHVSIPLYQ